MSNIRYSVFLFFVGIVITLASCEKEDSSEEKFFGTWQISEISIDGQLQTLAPCESEATLKFEDNNLCKRFDACMDTTYNDSWSYTNGMINILSFLPNAYQVIEQSNDLLLLSSNDFDSLGIIVITEYKYLKVD